MERVNVPGTVSDRLRSSVPHMRSVRMDDMIRQRLDTGMHIGDKASPSISLAGCGHLVKMLM